MEREKEIQVIAKVLNGHYCGDDECGKCKEPNCLDYIRAKKLYEAGCRIVKIQASKKEKII